MMETYKNILFATDLSDDCQKTFLKAVALSIELKGDIFVLHVIDRPHMALEARIKNIMGESTYEMIRCQQENDARSILVGKRGQLDVIHSALLKVCEDAINKDECSYIPSLDISVKDGDIVKEILATTEEKNIDIIVLTSPIKGSSRSTITKKIKKLIESSRTPVLVLSNYE